EWVTRAALRDLTEVFCQRLQQMGKQPGALSVALTGGRSAGAFYDAWAAQGVDTRWRFFWSDERMVPAEDPDSNVKLGWDRLLGPGMVAAERVHAPHTGLEADACAADYAQSIRTELGMERGGTPVFPLVILGMGADGHTGSLFPGRDPFADQDRLVRAVEPTTAHPHARITFTPRLINAAQEVWFLVTGAAKAWAVEQLAQRTAPVEQFPALAVDPSLVKITVFADESSTGGRRYGNSAAG
ncbi:MAG: 6-phosphogluconolactonase, partial [Terriglobales bacterium]